MDRAWGGQGLLEVHRVCHRLVGRSVQPLSTWSVAGIIRACTHRPWSTGPVVGLWRGEYGTCVDTEGA